MLILSRRYNESVKIGDDVTVTILGVRGGRVRIGVSAPKTVPVHREEVHERIRAELGTKPQWALEEVKDPSAAPR